MIVVTGGAGFIGSNLVRGLNERGRSDILVADELAEGAKLLNLVDCDVLDVLDRDVFLEGLRSGSAPGPIDAIFHQGACTDTMEWDGRRMLGANFEYPKALLGYALERGIPFLYASSAAVYGASRVFREEPANERPINLYGYSKLLFDQHVRRVLPHARSQVVGLRYFNVYGPREAHKGEMRSVAAKLHEQLAAGDEVRLFEASDGFAAGEQRRDFVWVGDVVATNLWLWAHPEVTGIFNLGSGRAQTFNDVARAVIAHHGRGEIAYIPFPEALRGAYQSDTCADISALRKAGYDAGFLSVEEAIPRYLAWLER